MRKVGNRSSRFGALTISACLIAAAAASSPAHASSGATAVSTGASDACALIAGHIQCWGYNGDGQFGDATRISRTAPAVVPGLGGVAVVSAGSGHTCVVTNGGGVKCWGLNGDGQVGDNTNTLRTTPVDVSGLTSGAAAVAAGETHTCALTTAGVAKCWGANGFGQLGNNTIVGSKVPVTVLSGATVYDAISVGDLHSCALTTTGGVQCWGRNVFGQLGDNTFTTRRTPVNVFGPLSGATAVSAGGNHTCALTTGGVVQCWGSNTDGELGNGTNDDSKVPVTVLSGGTTYTAVSAGADHTCALTSTGGIQCWGSNVDGELGDGSNDDSNVPVDVSGATTYTRVSAGTDHTCALATGGGVKCWGANVRGELGDGTNAPSPSPVDTLGFTITKSALRVGKSTVSQGSMLRFIVKVKYDGTKRASGTAAIYADDTFIGSGTLTNGKLDVKLPMNVSQGYHTMRAIYLGLGTLSSSRSGPRVVGVVP